MKFVLIEILIAIVLVQCISPDKSVVQNKYTTSDLEGNWTLSKVEIIEEKQSISKYKESIEAAYEQAFPVFMDNGILTPLSPDYISKRTKNLVFSGDSIFRLNYPLHCEDSNGYTIESDLLKIGNDLNGKSIGFSSDRDTMRISYLDRFGMYLEETYQRVTFDDSILNILKRYNTNFPLLAGTWELVKESSDEYGETYTLDFGYSIPDTIILKKEELAAALESDRSYYMLTNEKKRKYFLGYTGDFLLLTPDNWYNGEDPYIHFRRVEE